MSNSFDFSKQQMYFQIYLNVSEHDKKAKRGAGEREENSTAEILAAKTSATEIKMHPLLFRTSLAQIHNLDASLLPMSSLAIPISFTSASYPAAYSSTPPTMSILFIVASN